MPNQQPQTTALWEDLKQLTKSVVEEMNRDAELSSRTGGLESRLEDGDALVVSKVSVPKMYLTVRLSAEALEIHTRLRISEAESADREFREDLTIHFDANGASLRNPAGEVFTVDEAVFYILRPFLHLGAVDC
jgi:hypothetical protein